MANNNKKHKQINKQTNRKREKQNEKNITITTTTNTETNIQSLASYSPQHVLHRRYYLAIAQMTSTRKAYIFSLLGIIIK